jgi:Ran GTPase-activating protein (RanGAP) involved in mRNA processing and transport
LKLNRLDDKAGSKMCIDLKDSHTQKLQEIDFSANLLGNLFCEHLAEYLKLNPDIKKVDISCNAIEESSAAILKDSLLNNKNIIKCTIRNNKGMTDDTVEEINDIVMKNYLAY